LTSKTPIRKFKVFTLDLKSDYVDTSLRDRGRIFQNVGPTIEKVRSPLLLSLDLGTISNLYWDEHNDLAELFRFKDQTVFLQGQINLGVICIKVKW